MLNLTIVRLVVKNYFEAVFIISLPAGQRTFCGLNVL
jgi:hypothetical protein